MPVEPLTSEPPVLEPLYYRDNFETLCETVRAQYFDLLEAPEQEFFRCYDKLDETARCLYVRLVSRRGLLFRSEQLSYPELGALDDAIKQLCQQGLAQVNDTPPVNELLKLLRKDELLAIYADSTALTRSMRKSELQEILLANLPEEELIACWLAARAADCYLLEVCYQDCIDLLQLLFFGNRRQSLTEFVLSDLGVTRYWPYPLDREYRLFESRAQIDDYLLLSGLREDYYLALEAQDKEQVEAIASQLMTSAETPWLESRRDRLRNRVARQLERYQSWDAALELYACSDAHPARERRVRILKSLQRFDDALELALAMRSDPWCEAELDFLQRQIPALEKSLQLPYEKPARDSHPRESLELAVAPRVELAVANHYADAWEEVAWVENTLVNGVFGLALWEQIFQALPGAFVNPFQAAPLDMFTGDFYRTRRDSIDQRLDFLSDADLEAELLPAFDRYQDVNNRWVNWRYLSRELVQKALRVIPREDWLHLWRRILFDPEANRSGFPDLVALDDNRGYCFIEVKGPGDQLQLNQKRWLRYFKAKGIPAQVAWVQWRDD